jgi:hypothetical protein
MVVAKSTRMPSIERVVGRVVEDSDLVASWGEVIMKIRAQVLPKGFLLSPSHQIPDLPIAIQNTPACHFTSLSPGARASPSPFV